MRLAAALIVAGACCAAAPSRAQGAPPNPFASNYPSAPPRIDDHERRIFVPRPRANRSAPRFQRGPVPPGDIPGR